MTLPTFTAHLGEGTVGHEFADRVVIQLARQGLLDDRPQRCLCGNPVDRCPGCRGLLGVEGAA